MDYAVWSCSSFILVKLHHANEASERITDKRKRRINKPSYIPSLVRILQRNRNRTSKGYTRAHTYIYVYVYLDIHTYRYLHIHIDLF